MKFSFLFFLFLAPLLTIPFQAMESVQFKHMEGYIEKERAKLPEQLNDLSAESEGSNNDAAPEGEEGVSWKKLYKTIKKNLRSALDSSFTKKNEVKENDENKLLQTYTVFTQGLISDVHQFEFRTPLGKALIETFKKQLSGNNIGKIIKALTNTAEIWEQKDVVKIHYQQHESKYGDIEDVTKDVSKKDIEDDIELFSSIPNYFAANINDPKYPKIKEAIEQRLAKAEVSLEKFKD